ncbi:MAG: NADH-quinone oxidoreductase subunit J [Panacibacter sp.]
MNWIFYTGAATAVIATYLAVSRYNPMHALLYLIVSFLATAVVFYTLGASFVALLQIILYAGAIVVLFLFVVMMLNLGDETARQEKQWLHPKAWIGPALLCAVLLLQLLFMIGNNEAETFTVKPIPVKTISKDLFQSYMLAVELASMLLMAGIVGAAHVGLQKKKIKHRFLEQVENL